MKCLTSTMGESEWYSSRLGRNYQEDGTPLIII